MLPRKKRLTKEAFSTHFSHGKRFHTPRYTVVYAAYPTFHASVVVSKKVAKRAVIRNKLRRQIYAMLVSLNKVYTYGGVWIVLVKQQSPIPSEEVYTEIEGVFKKVYTQHT